MDKRNSRHFFIVKYGTLIIDWLMESQSYLVHYAKVIGYLVLSSICNLFIDMRGKRR